jgi:hypothetical protein
MEAIISQFFIAGTYARQPFPHLNATIEPVSPPPTAILCLRCWALFGGSRVVLGALIAVYVCCLGLQIVRHPR